MLKTVDTFGNNCQRPVFSVCVSNICIKITNLWKCGLNWSSNLQRIMKEKTSLLPYFVCCYIHNKRLQMKSFIIWVRNYLFLKTMFLQREPFLTISSSPLLITKLVCMLIVSSGNKETNNIGKRKLLKVTADKLSI